MDKEKALKTQEMWRDYENTSFWLDTINHPQKHIIIAEGQIVGVDNDYRMAIESLNYILKGETLNTLNIRDKHVR